MTEIVRRGFLIGLGASLFAAPAIVRAASLMPVRNMLVLPPFGWGSFVPPEGVMYQWVTRKVVGEVVPWYEEAMVDGGWQSVDASRYNKQFAISGNEVELGGQVLMERVADDWVGMTKLPKRLDELKEVVARVNARWGPKGTAPLIMPEVRDTVVTKDSYTMSTSYSDRLKERSGA